MPVKSYDQLKLDQGLVRTIAEECFDECHLPSINLVLNTSPLVVTNHCNKCVSTTGRGEGISPGEDSKHCRNCTCYPVYPISKVGRGENEDGDKLVSFLHYGFKQGTRILTKVVEFIQKLIHKTHLARNNLNEQNSLQKICKIPRQLQTDSHEQAVQRTDRKLDEDYVKDN